MNARLEEVLYLLLWSAETMMRPTFRNMTESYEDWAHRAGLGPHLARLQKRKLVDASRRPADDRILRLTERGRMRALGGRDPLARWSRPWDGWWTFVLFDVPIDENVQRRRLRRSLGRMGLGCLQGSVWVTPDLEDAGKSLEAAASDVRSLLIMKARPYAGESDESIVTAAWDFRGLTLFYERYLQLLKTRPRASGKMRVDPEALCRFAAAERAAWRAAVSRDPMLPFCLHPPGYLGPEAFRQRQEALGSAGRGLLTP